MKLTLKKAALAASAVATLGASGLVSAQGVDTLESKLYPRYVTDDMLLNADKDHSNWLHYGKDYQSTRYSALSQINKGNVKNLRPVWNLSFGVLEGQDSQANVVNGMIYVTTSFNKVIAVEATTGKIVWKYERELPGDVFPKLCCDVVNRGVALYKNKVYLATLDAHIVALDNATGKVVWDKKHGDYTYAETFTIMPMALRGKIIFGTAGAEYGVRGWIKAINADTGDLVWQTYTIPGPGEPGNDTWAGDSWKYGGGSAWITGSYDAETNRLFWPVGNPGPDFDRHVRLGDNLFSNSNLVMDPDTGKILSYFNYTPNDPYDYDGVNEMILVDVGGKKLWLHGSRNGHIYGIDRNATVAGKAGKENKCVWVNTLSRVNWTQPITAADERTPIISPSCWSRGVAPTRKPVLRSCDVSPAMDAAMQTDVPTMSAVAFPAMSVHPIRKNTRLVPSSVAMVMPDVGFDVTPISPTMRALTVTKKNAKTAMRIDASPRTTIESR